MSEARSRVASTCFYRNTMQSNNIINNMIGKGGNDECYTPSNVVEAIAPYVPEGKVIWCPFDKEDSAFVQVLGGRNKVIHSHIDDGQDFFIYEPSEQWDMIISNPPFSGKSKVLKRVISFGKPFALLLPYMMGNDPAPIRLFHARGIQLQMLLFVERIDFMQKSPRSDKKQPFKSVFYCTDLLTRDLITVSLDEVGIQNNNNLSLF